MTDDFNRSTSPTGDYEKGKRITEMIFQDCRNGRWVSSEEMGWPMVAIGSKICSYMSGLVIYIDCGISSAWQMDGWEAIGG